MPSVHILDMSYIIWQPNYYTASKKCTIHHLTFHSVLCFKTQLALASLEFWIWTVLLRLLDKDHSNTGPVFVCIWR